MKMLTIIKDDSITGVQYGIVEFPETKRKLSKIGRAYQKIKKIQEARNEIRRMERTKKK